MTTLENDILAMRKALETIADRYHADRCPVYQFSGGKGACNCHVGIARAALTTSQVPITHETAKDAKDDARAAAIEATWKERQGEDYGSY